MDLRMEQAAKSRRKQEIQGIYESSFEKEDQMPFWLMLAMSRLRSTEFLAFYDGEILCGFVYMATIRKLTFILFFAVDEGLRSRGYGSAILEAVQARRPEQKLLVSIEPCQEGAADLEARRRRKAFYRRNGYQETGYFIRIGGGGKAQEVLVKNGGFDKGEFIRFFLRYSNLTIIPKVWKAGS